MKIAPELLQLVVDHALREAPNECCGFVWLRDGVAFEVVAVENQTPSPFRFEMGAEYARIVMAIEDAGDEGVIYHSHTRSEPYPSQTDINFAKNWPGWEWLIVGLASGPEAQVRSYLIEGGEVREVAVE